MTSSIDFFSTKFGIIRSLILTLAGWLCLTMVVSQVESSGLVVKNVGSDMCLPRFESLHCHVLAMALRQPLNTCASVSSSDISESC